MICVTFLDVARVKQHTAKRESHAKRVRFSLGRVLFDSCDVQIRATKSNASGHCLGLVTVFIKLKPKRGWGQFFAPVDRPWTLSGPDAASTRIAGGGGGAGAASQAVPRPAALQAPLAEAVGPQRRLSRRPPPALGPAPGDAGGGRAIATGGEAPITPLQRAVTQAEVEGRCRHLAGWSRRCSRT